MPQIVKAKISQLRPLHRLKPRRIANSPPYRLAFVRKANLRVLPFHAYQDSDRISIQRDTSRRSILGAVQPRGSAFQIHAAPLQAGYLRSPATCCQRKPDNRRHVRRTGRNQPIRLLSRQPPIPRHFAREQLDLRETVDPLPFVPGHSQHCANRRQVAVDRSRSNLPLPQPLTDGPDRVPVNLRKELHP